MIKLMKCIRRLAECLAEENIMELEGIPMDKKTVLNTRGLINKIRNKIIEWYPNESEFLDRQIEETILEFQEMFERKIELKYRPNNAKFDDKAFINLSPIEVPEDVAMVLGFGPKFCFPNKKSIDHLVYFLDDFEGNLESSFPIETFLESYKQLSIEMRAEDKTYRLNRSVWLEFLHYRVSRFVRLNSGLIIARSDKGKHTVLMQKELYVQKVDQLILMTDDYVRIDDINILELERRNNEFVIKLKALGSLNDINEFIDFCTTPARMYGLIKIHKKDFPVRPITSACSSPGFKLAKFFTGLLGNIFGEEGFHIRNSLYFVNKLRDLHIENDEMMLSFDVVSMFTNIPVNHMISIIEIRKELILEKYGIGYSLFREVLLFLLKECAVFQWNGNSYRQRDSLAMGSPLSPILAKILMSHAINLTLPLLPSRPKLLVLYVDDSFWIVKRQHVECILNQLNDYNSNIKFTVEMEKEGQLNFLDVTIIRRDNRLITNWFKKPFASDRILNYFSNHERNCINETASSYVRMVLNLSDGEFFVQNRSVLWGILENNSFPITEIMGILHKNYSLMKQLPRSEGFSGRYVPIRYHGRLTQRLKNRINGFIPNKRLVGIPDRFNSRFFSCLKDPIRIVDRSNVVIIFTCECKGKRILKHTQFGNRVGNMCEEILKTNGRSDMCIGDFHCFKKFVCIQCRNYMSMKRTFSSLTYRFRETLHNTEMIRPCFGAMKMIDNHLYKYDG